MGRRMENFYPLTRLSTLVAYREAEGKRLREDLLFAKGAGKIDGGRVRALVQTYYRNKLLQRIEEVYSSKG